MISIDDLPPSDPSSSDHHHQEQVSHNLKINSDQKAPAVSDIDLLKSPDATLDDTNNPLPNFSIRDYVFSSRKKDIACNWPFSREILQLCLHYGVKNLLPPFKTLDLLRDNSSVRLPNEQIISSFDGKSTNDRFISVSSCGTKSNQKLASESQKTDNTTTQTALKKCKFLVKLNWGVETVKEVTTNNLILSETMASKVCPVCKTFSSSSNTTLNAHIDQCLSGESSMKWNTNPKKMVKHSVKPRKTRSMVDIYKTAAYCTVEELDRRNGTSWATNYSKFPNQELNFQGEEKKEEPREPSFIVADHEGAVYIDTNGTKVRILSVPKVGALDDLEAQKSQNIGKGSKVTRRKFLKFSPSGKKFRFVKPHHGTSEVRSSREEKVAICDKENQGERPVKAQEHMQMDHLAITRAPWACSKRTHLAKRFRDKDGMLHSRCGSKMPKENTILREGFEDSLNIGLKGSKFLSLKKNLLSVSQEHIPESKKRKFSDLKKSCVVGPSQDSSEQNSTREEETSEKLSFEKKSVSSNGGFSGGFESARTEIQSRDEGSFMGLRNSLDDEFSKLVSPLNHQFDSRECVELYQDREGSPKCSHINNILIGHNIEDHMDDTEKQENYFPDRVDPIPIPGPPGSFLPSPGGDMVSEEVQGNSSLTTTSRVQSNEDQHHHNKMDQDSMSDSPISTISNPTLATSVDLIFTDKGPIPTWCCSRKEVAFSQSGASNYQESAFLRIPNSINHPTSPPLRLPKTGKPLADASVRLSVNRDCDSAVSPSKPVLRLMGKNLTVVNTDEDVSWSRQLKPPMGGHGHQHLQNEHYNSFFHSHPPRPQHFNVHPSNNSRISPVDLRLMQPVDRYRLDTQMARDAHMDNAPSSLTKDMIIIDAAAENEGDYGNRMNRMQCPGNLYGDGVSLAFRNGGFQSEVSNDGNLGRWGLHASSLGSPMAFMPHMRSKAYYPRSFS